MSRYWSASRGIWDCDLPKWLICHAHDLLLHLIAPLLATQVPVQEREKILKKEGLDPSCLVNLTLVYKVQEVLYM